MGDRAIVVFTDDNCEGEYSPGVYVHNSGYRIAELIREFAPAMRRGDAGYSAARFCGELHECIPGKLGLGLVPGPGKPQSYDDWKKYSHGDAGVFVVNVSNGDVATYGGYGQPFVVPPDSFGVED